MIMVYLQSYFDESGSIEKNKMISFCGLVGSNPQWEVCHHHWKMALESLGIKAFKANEALHYIKPLSKSVPACGIEKRTEALVPLIRAVRRSIPLGISVVMDCSAFKSLSEEERLLFHDDPTYLTFVQALFAIQKVLGNISPDPHTHVSLVCDDTHKYAVEYLAAFHRVKQIHPEFRGLFVSIGFADDNYIEQLQVADFLASIMRKEAEHKFFGSPFDMRELYEIFTKPSDDYILAPCFIGGEFLGELVEARKQAISRKRRDKVKSKH